MAANLAGCATGKVEISEPQHNTITVEKTIPYECGTPPPYDAFIPLPVLWAEGVTKDGEPAIVLTADYYQNLGKNTSRLKKSVTQLRAQRDFYRDCIERSKEDERGNTEPAAEDN